MSTDNTLLFIKKEESNLAHQFNVAHCSCMSEVLSYDYQLNLVVGKGFVLIPTFLEHGQPVIHPCPGGWEWICCHEWKETASCKWKKDMVNWFTRLHLCRYSFQMLCKCLTNKNVWRINCKRKVPRFCRPMMKMNVYGILFFCIYFVFWGYGGWGVSLYTAYALPEIIVSGNN